MFYPLEDPPESSKTGVTGRWRQWLGHCFFTLLKVRKAKIKVRKAANPAADECTSLFCRGYLHLLVLLLICAHECLARNVEMGTASTAGADKGQKRVLDPLEIGLQMTWAIERVLGTEPEPHGATHALHCEPPLQSHVLFFLLWWNTQQKQLGGKKATFPFRKEGLLLTQIQKHSPPPWGSHDTTAGDIVSKVRKLLETNALLLSLFHSVKSLDHGMVLYTFSVFFLPQLTLPRNCLTDIHT